MARSPSKQSTQHRVNDRARRNEQHPLPSKGPNSTLHGLQSAIGNHAVSELIRSSRESIDVDLSGVRIHTGPDSDASTQAKGALAFATGRDVFIGNGIDLASKFGQSVLLHEMTHVVQQERGAAGVPISSTTNLEAEANALSGMGAGAAFDAPGAAAPGAVQKLEAQGTPRSQEQDEQWAAELARDEARLVKILTSVVYTEWDEAETIEILQRWAARRTQAAADAGHGMRSDLLDRLLSRLRRTPVWTRWGRSTCYEAMFSKFERANEVRTIRDTSSIDYVGREEEADKTRAERREEDLFGEAVLGWRTNRIESAAAADSPVEIARADWVIRELAKLRPEQLTPQTRLLSEGVAREGRDFLLKRTHVVTAGDQVRKVKALAREAVVTMLEFAIAELTFGAARAFGPKILEGIVGAEAAGVAGRASTEGAATITEGGLTTGSLESATAKEAASREVGENVISLEGRARTGTFEGLTPGERPVTNISEATAARSAPPRPPTEPVAQALPKAANEDVEVLSAEAEEVGMKKAAGAEAQTSEQTVASLKGKKPPKSSGVPKASSGAKTKGLGKSSGSEIGTKIQMTESGPTGTVKVDPRAMGAASEVAQIDQLGVQKMKNWFKTLDAVSGGSRRVFVSETTGKVVVEFRNVTGVSMKATTLSDAAMNLKYLEREMGEAADKLVEFTSWKRTEGGVTHFVSSVESRELHLTLDAQAEIMNEKQVFDTMQGLQKRLESKGVDFKWFVDRADGSHWAGPEWYRDYLRGRDIIEGM